VTERESSQRTSHRLASRAVDGLYILLSLAAAAWALLLSALCIGDSCCEDLRVRWWAYIASANAFAGSVLALRRRTRTAGRLLLAVPVVVAIVITFADP